MATTKKISELDELTAPAADDDVEIRDVSDNVPVATGKNKRMKWLTMVTKMFASRFGADAGSTDTYVVTLDPVPLGYVTGEHYRFKANTANTGACTVNFNSLGAKTIKKAAGGITTDLDTNDIRAGQWVDLVFDGTNMQMQSLLGNSPSGGTGGIGDVVGPGSATDNAIARFDSTTGKLIQNSVVIVSDAGAITVPEIAAPSTPAAGTVHIYAKSDKHLYIKDSTGTETDLTSAGGGSIAPLVIEDANTVAQRNGANAQLFNIYRTFTDASNYERLKIGPVGSDFVIQSEAAGTGSQRQLQLRYGASRILAFDGGSLYPDSNNVIALGTGSVRFSILRAVDVMVQTSFQFEGQAELRDAGNTNGGVTRFCKNGGNPGTWAAGVQAESLGSSNLNNYTYTSNAHMQRWSSGAAIDVTGMVRGQVDGQTHFIVNVGSNNITLKHESASSTAGNRFLNSTGADIVLAANEAIFVIYDSTTARWRGYKA